jgi:hypothetical protein
MRICALTGVFVITATVIAVVMVHDLYRDPVLCGATALAGATMVVLALRCVARRANSDGCDPIDRRDTIRALCDEDEENFDDSAGHGTRLA